MSVKIEKKIQILLSLIILFVLISGCADKEALLIHEESEPTPVDIDLTVLSTTVLSAELMNIIVNSEDYLGKTIRVRGTYYYLFYEQTGKYYHYVITKEGDECCQEGIEFMLSGEPVFPDDFPLVKTPIEVEGVFSLYEELDRRYYYLAVDDIFLLR